MFPFFSSPSLGGREKGRGIFEGRVSFAEFHPHPRPLPGRVREKESREKRREIATGYEQTTLAMTEKVLRRKRKETIRGKEFPLILVDIFPPVVFILLSFIFLLRRRLSAFSLGAFAF